MSDQKEVAVQLLPKQLIAYNYLEDEITNEVLYGGGARSGKTYLGCEWEIIRRWQYPGSAGLIGRRELKRLKQTTLKTFFEVCKDFGLRPDIDYKFNAQDFTVSFPNGPDPKNPFHLGSIIFFVDLAHKPSDPEYDRLGSYGLTDAFIDEAQEIHYKAINVLGGRFSLLKKLGQNGEVLWDAKIPKVLYSCNPAQNWIYSEFYKPNKEGTLPKYRKFVPALVTDNPFVPQSYIDNLRTKDTVTVQRLLHGNFEYDDDKSRLLTYEEIQDLFTNNPDFNQMRFISCDVARLGQDTTRIVVWQGLRAFHFEKHEKWTTDQTANRLKELEIEHQVRRSNIVVDQDGVGGGVVDQVRGCTPFVNGGSPIQPPEAKNNPTKKVNFSNLKTQCAFKLQELAKSGKIRLDVEDAMLKGEIIQELGQLKQKDMDDDSKKIALISKDEMKESLRRSPDIMDTIIMRMVFELSPVTSIASPSAERPIQTAIKLRRKLYNPDTGAFEYR